MTVELAKKARGCVSRTEPSKKKIIIKKGEMKKDSENLLPEQAARGFGP